MRALPFYSRCRQKQKWKGRGTIIISKSKKVVILSNREDLTADYVVLELRKRSIPFFRFNTEDFPLSVNLSLDFQKGHPDGLLISRDFTIALGEIQSIWYRRPALPSFDSVQIDSGIKEFCVKESYYALEGVWASVDCFWVSDPFNIRKAENKPYQLKVASEVGFKIPSTLISNNAQDIKRFSEENNNSLIIKPIRTGTFKDKGGAKIIFTNDLPAFDMDSFNSSIKVPSIFQERVEKKYDIRVTVIGDKVFPAEIHSQVYKHSMVDWRRVENPDIVHKQHTLPVDIEAKCRILTKTLGLQFAAIDLVLTPNDDYYFLEINPNGQWAWIQERTGYALTETLVDLLCQPNL